MYGGYQGRYEPKTYVALFDDPEPAAEAIERLRELGIADRFIQVQSGVPWKPEVLGRSERPSAVPKYGMMGAIMGFLAAVALSFGTPLLYPLYVGGMPLLTVPTSLVVLFELTMLGLLLGTFFGMLTEALLPPVVGKRVYHPEVSDGAIAVFFQAPATLAERARTLLQQMGVSDIEEAEGTFV